jgi:hypothetical protein
MPTEQPVTLRTLDGFRLAGTLMTPDQPSGRAVVFVHGGGVTREEGGFFTRLAAGLGKAGIASLRYDLRAHGESDGQQETDNTLTGHLNDIRVAVAEIRERTDATQIALLGASFGGGLAAYYAAKGPDQLSRLVLLNPQLNYKNRYIEQKPWWPGDYLDPEAARRLQEDGFLSHSDTVKHSRAMLNEVSWIHPWQVVEDITAPTLIVHGTRDTFVSVEGSREAAPRLRVPHRLVEIEGAQHGFAVHEDPQYLNPRTQEWQAFVIETATDWISGDPPGT